KELILQVKNAAWDVGWPPGRGPPSNRSPPSSQPSPNPGPQGPGSPRGSDPSATATGGDPPPKGDPSGASAAIDDVRQNVGKEVKALVARNSLQQAEAAARREVGSAWLNQLVGHRGRGFSAALNALSSPELKTHVSTLTKWKALLVRQQAQSA